MDNEQRPYPSNGHHRASALAVFSGPGKKSPKGYTPALYANSDLNGAVGEGEENGSATVLILGKS